MNIGIGIFEMFVYGMIKVRRIIMGTDDGEMWQPFCFVSFPTEACDSGDNREAITCPPLTSSLPSSQSNLHGALVFIIPGSIRALFLKEKMFKKDDMDTKI